VRAAILREYGTTPEPDEFDEPRAGEGQVVVDVLAAALNPVDLSIASGRFYGGVPDVPYVVGSEGAGRLADGTPVYFHDPVAPFGACAQRSLAREDAVIPLPAGLDPAVAAGLGIAGLAAWVSLQWRAQLAAGETVLVLGASGVVGQIGVQAARLLGAGRVVAAARSEEGLRRARELGADATVRLGGDDVAGALRDAAGGGFDVVLDPLWGAPAEAAAEATNPGARLVQLGQSAGPTATLASATVRGRVLSILGHANFHTPPAVRRSTYERMADHAAAGELVLDVRQMGLDEIAEAWALQAAGPHRKLVITP
jgi:NADPH2:quinone reductase